jgi:hypothetical protein
MSLSVGETRGVHSQGVLGVVRKAWGMFNVCDVNVNAVFISVGVICYPCMQRIDITNHVCLELTKKIEVMEWPWEREHTSIDAASKNRYGPVTNLTL